MEAHWDFQRQLNNDLKYKWNQHNITDLQSFWVWKFLGDGNPKSRVNWRHTGNPSSPLSSTVISSSRLLVNGISSSSHMKAVGGCSSPFPKINLWDLNISPAHSCSPTFSPQSTIWTACQRQDQCLHYLWVQDGRHGLRIQFKPLDNQRGEGSMS